MKLQSCKDYVMSEQMADAFAHYLLPYLREFCQNKDNTEFNTDDK